jgi:hypothetical protein
MAQQWEYKLVQGTYTGASVIGIAQREGAAGWELVVVIPETPHRTQPPRADLVFKRLLDR